MKIVKQLLCLAFLACGCLAYAQTEYSAQDDGLSELLKQRAQQKVAQLTDNISFMADKSKDLKTREFYKKMALKLFVAEGEPFEEDGVTNSGVKMETTSKYRKNPSRKLMKDYFNGLINLRYSKVDIQSTKVQDIKVSDLQKIGDNQYVCTAYFEQVFRGFRDGVPVYSDRTKKKVKVYILGDETLDRMEYLVLLGDVTALETLPY
ncbi:MAG: hypothetical protein J1D77_03230 [Muribaculaceae bacterium]|nr:hypothetical protein [Muribaculaceae bacterium]